MHQLMEVMVYKKSLQRVLVSSLLAEILEEDILGFSTFK